MRAELKIGIAVGLIIAAVAVLYVVFHDSGVPVPAVSPVTPPAVAPPVAPAASPAAPVETDTLVPSFVAPASPGPAAVEPPADITDLAPVAETTTQPIAPEATRAEGPLAVRFTASPTTRPTVVPIPPRVSLTARAAGTTSYVVKPGDKGFWHIAEVVYGPGKGKYWRIIAAANPQAESTRLREGMRLTIPPLPGEPVTPSPTVTPLASAEERVYTVQPDDGWWVISRKVYGDGRYWRQLRQANPHAEGVLKPGQTIRVPPLEGLGSAAPPAPTAPAPPPPPLPSDDRPIFD